MAVMAVKSCSSASRMIMPIYYNIGLSIMIDKIGAALAARIHLERTSRVWSMDELSSRAVVSRATISKIERQECSPTATVMGRLSGAFGISISSLLANAEADEE